MKQLALFGKYPGLPNIEEAILNLAQQQKPDDFSMSHLLRVGFTGTIY